MLTCLDTARIILGLSRCINLVLFLFFSFNLQGQYIRFADFNKGVGDGLLRINNPLLVSDSLIYLSVDDGIHGRELWVSDGSPQGTHLLKDINPGPESSNCKYFIEYRGKILFSANDGVHGHELWETDGSAEGTKLIIDYSNSSSGPNSSFSTLASNSGYSEDFQIFDDILYYATRDFMRTDGTADGTYQVIDLDIPVGDNPSHFLQFRDSLYFVANSADGIRQITRSDGTAEGTQLIDSLEYIEVFDPNVAGDLIFMGANSGGLQANTQIGVCDGTPEGTFIINIDTDISSGATSGENGDSFFYYKDQVFFKATHGFTGSELWSSDGTETGTNLFLDINDSGSSSPRNFIVINDQMFFKADDGIHGRELWVSDGTTSGTQLFMDINQGSGDGLANTYDYFKLGEHIYFEAQEVDDNLELWRTDGTIEGTVRVADIGKVTSSFPDNFFTFNGKLFCSAYTEEHGNELYLIDESIVPLEYSVEHNGPFACNEEGNGMINVSFSGGSSPHNISWNIADLEGFELSGLDTGLYVFTITDVNGFEVCDSVLINYLDDLSFTIDAFPSLDSLSTGMILFNPAGGTPPYTYCVSSLTSDEPLFENLYPDWYELSVKDDLGCIENQLFKLENVASDTTDFDGDGVYYSEDCNDFDPGVYPGNEEIPYNAVDDDCDPATPDDDIDGDGFNVDTDCDDMNAEVNPDQIEMVYNGIDDDCDPATLDDDLDGDGFNVDIDCDDENADINPDALEIAYNNLDDDCDPATPDDDLDGDGFNVNDDCDDMNADINPDATEIENNGIDEDCDGEDLVSSIHILNQTTFNIYPNPVTESLYIEINGNDDYMIQLYELNGKQVYSAKNISFISFNDLAQDVYFLRCIDVETNNYFVKKLFVVH